MICWSHKCANSETGRTVACTSFGEDPFPIPCMLAASLRGRPPNVQGTRLACGLQREADAPPPPPLQRAPERGLALAGDVAAHLAPAVHRPMGFIPYAVRPLSSRACPGSQNHPWCHTIQVSVITSITSSRVRVSSCLLLSLRVYYIV